MSFLENTLHDIKTPVSIINLMLQSIENVDALDEGCKQYFEMTKKYVVKLIDILHKSNDYNKIIRKDFLPTLRLTNVVEVIEGAVEMARQMARRKGIDVSVISNVATKMMQTDDKMIEKIVLNLMSNAVKFAPMGGEIAVEIADLNEWLVISVADNGAGFSQEMIENGIERYNTQTDGINPNGSGIGLSMVKELVELLYGKVEITNGSNGGGLVTVMLNVVCYETECEEPGDYDGIQIELM